jgi:predicted oxidoreductase
MIPKYSAENFPRILQLTEDLKSIASRHDATVSQVALAWLLSQGEDIIPIPGTRSVKVYTPHDRALVPMLIISFSITKRTWALSRSR